MAEKEFLSRTEVAGLLGVSPATVSRWARKGYLPWVETAGGHRRYPREEVRRLRDRLFGGRRYQVLPSKRVQDLIDKLEFRIAQDDRLIEIRCHGRAGQGLITAGELLAEAALRDGKYFQAFPEFGPERGGAPMEAFIRISTQPMHIHSSVLRPNVVMVLDATLLTLEAVLRGTGKETLVIINYPGSPDDLKRSVKELERLSPIPIDATGISKEILKRPFPNIPMLGALLRASPIVPADLMEEVIALRLGRRLSQALVEANRSAFWEGYRRVNVGDAREMRDKVRA